MWSRLLELLGRGYRGGPAGDAVRKAFASRYPNYELTEIRLRARESDRDVVAVLYRDRDDDRSWRGIPPYKLFAVRRDLTTEEIPKDRDSPYALRGVK